MAWSDPATATVGQVLTATYWNQQVRDNLKALAPVGKSEFFVRLPTSVETLIEGAWLEENGVDVSRATYATLWTHLGTTCGVQWSGSTTLNGALDASQTNVTLAAWPTGWPKDGRKILIQVDSEKMLITAGQGTTAITVTRGVEGTTAATHLSGAAVSSPSQSPFGHGDGSTTFTLPDSRGRAKIAAGLAGHADIAMGISENVLYVNRRPAHAHGPPGTINLGSSGGGNPWSGSQTTDAGPAYLAAGIWAVKT